MGRYPNIFMIVIAFRQFMTLKNNIITLSLLSSSQRILGNRSSSTFSNVLLLIGSRTLIIKNSRAAPVFSPSKHRVWHLVSRLLGIETFLNFLRVSVSVAKILVSKKVSVSVSKIFSLEKKSRYRSRKYLVSKKVSVSVSKTLVSKKVSVMT